MTEPGGETASSSGGSGGTDTSMPNANAGEPACALVSGRSSMATWIEQRCTQLANCCELDELAGLLGGGTQDAASCQRVLTTALVSSVSAPEGLTRLAAIDEPLAQAVFMTDPKVTEIRAGCLDACLELQASAGCAPDRVPGRCAINDHYPGAACDPNLLLRGTLGADALCNPMLTALGLDTQCAYGLDCLLQGDGSGRCVPVPTLGKACNPIQGKVRGNCEHDLVCDPTARVCVRGALVGELCDHSEGANFRGCRAGLECGHNLRCVPSCQAGAACEDEQGRSDDLRCPLHFACVPGPRAYCDVRTNEERGCDTDADCAQGKYCDSAKDTGPLGDKQVGRCVALIGENMPCSRPRSCAAGLFCDGQRCVAKLGTDQRCERSFQCQAGRCAHVDRDASGQLIDFSRRCVDQGRSDSRCVPRDSSLLDHPDTALWMRPELRRVQVADAPWVSACGDAGCESDELGQGSCRPFAQLDQPCDYVAGNAVPSCAPFTHCVQGRCQAFLGLGASCGAQSEDWDARQSQHAGGFAAPVCDPLRSRCVQGDKDWYCRYDNARASASLCDAK